MSKNQKKERLEPLRKWHPVRRKLVLHIKKQLTSFSVKKEENVVIDLNMNVQCQEYIPPISCLQWKKIF